jgi:hypothetical protein
VAVKIIPIGTELFEPDDLHRVTFQFPTQDDAIVFYEAMKELLDGAELRMSARPARPRDSKP